MKIATIFFAIFLSTAVNVWSQQELTASTTQSPVVATKTTAKPNQQVVRITGVRFAYPLVQKWIDEFNKEYPDVQVIIESRSSSDPKEYDILVESYEQSEEIKEQREYVYIARYAVLPVANSKSEFAKVYSDKGLDKDLITQIFFHDIYADTEEQKDIKAPFTVYTRLQKAGAPISFSHYYGFEQKDVKGKAIAGADEHLLKALLRDSTGISYLPSPVIYDRNTSKVVAGITVLPVDLNGNGKVNDEEKFYDEVTTVAQRIEGSRTKDLNNLPLGYIHLSVDKSGVSPHALTFLKWVVRNGEKDLHALGYLKPEPEKLEKDQFEEFASKRLK
jgi:ABC-type phosphate transport system substrate-binding protein